MSRLVFAFGMRQEALFNTQEFVSHSKNLEKCHLEADNPDSADAKGRFLGFFSGKHINTQYGELYSDMTTVLISAAFAFIGTEITAIVAAETANVCTKISQSSWQIDTCV